MPIRSYEQHTPQISAHTYIDSMAVIIGQVSIGEQSSVWPCCVLRGDVQSITVGRYTNIQDGSIIHVSHANEFNPQGFSTIIGDYVTIGHAAVVHACTIGNDVLIGMNATVLDGAVVEDKVIVGAGSVVGPGKILESGHLYVGSPARKARKLKESELKFLRYSAEHYAKLKDKHQAANETSK